MEKNKKNKVFELNFIVFKLVIPVYKLCKPYMKCTHFNILGEFCSYVKLNSEPYLRKLTTL